MSLHRLLFCVPAGLLFVGCPAKVATIDVVPARVSFDSEAATKTPTVGLKDSDGNVLEDTDKVPAWTSKDPAIATVDAAGVVKPVGSGATTVTAAIDEASGTAAVDVVLLKRIQLQNPVMVTVVGAANDALVLNFINERGEPIVVDAARAKKWPVEWKTADAAVASVDENGVVRGIAAGTTTLIVAVNELKAEMTITVNPAPEVIDPNAPAVPVPEGPQKPSP